MEGTGPIDRLLSRHFSKLSQQLDDLMHTTAGAYISWGSFRGSSVAQRIQTSEI